MWVGLTKVSGRWPQYLDVSGFDKGDWWAATVPRFEWV